ncbi:MAG: hypothetical protein IJB60_09245 [Bacteroidaceae bacterium]|nr:hypothetical protein [Bacteroidaceae bacterium]MBQ3189594.1 hypothetical protein [Bacteroidaceae bacterium]
MKKQGCYFYLEKERNNDLLRAFNLLYAQSSRTIDTSFYSELANQPSKRFWVSEERASIIISKMLSGNTLSNMIENKRQMFHDIYSIYQNLKREYPHLSHIELVCMSVNHQAPRFYLTPNTVKELIYRIKRKWYENNPHRYKK